MPTLAIRCLGPLEIRLGGKPLEGFETRKARALLVYLACHAGEAMTRAHLEVLLWSESPPELASRSLRQALMNLRRILPADSLRITRAAIAFNPASAFQLDLQQFENDPPEVNLYRGPFLQGFDLRDAQGWEEWLLARREQLQARALAALEHLGAQHAARGEFRQAADYYHRALALDPWRENSHQALMQMYALMGDRSAALAQYTKGRAALAEGLGIAPLPETDALYRRILEGTVEPLQDVESPVPILPFVGRGDAYVRLLAAWQESKKRGAILTLIEGEAGLGKTRLVEEVLRQIAMHGALVARGRCVEFAAEVPYRPIVEALRCLLSRGAEEQGGKGDISSAPLLPRSLAPIWLAELTRLLPELRERYPDLPAPFTADDESARQRLFEAVSRFVRHSIAHPKSKSRNKGLVFFLDDLHWADVATLDLLNHLVRALTSPPTPLLGEEEDDNFPFPDREGGREDRSIWFVGTYRPDERPLSHPLTRLRQGLARDILAERVQLTPLTDEAVSEIAAALSDDPALGPFLQRESGGNPFILSEVVKGLYETGRLQEAASGRWKIAGALTAASLPDRVEDITLQRVGRLSEESQWLLNFAVMIGEPFKPDLLADIVRDRAEVIPATLKDWEERRLLRQDVTGKFDFVHDKIRAAIYHHISPDLRKLLHERIGQALLDRTVERADSTPNAAAQIAYHFEQSLNPHRARPFLAHAAEAARQVYAHPAAIDYYQRLLFLLPPEEQIEILIRLGDLWHLVGEWSEAITLYRQVMASAEAVGDVRAQARAWNQLSYVQADQGDYRAMLESTERAEQLARAGGALAQVELAEALHRKGFVFYRLGNLKAALELAEQALALSPDLGPSAQRQLKSSLGLMGAVNKLQGRYKKARECYERALTLHRESGERGREGDLYRDLGEVARLRGDYAQAAALYRESLGILQEVHDRPGQIASLSDLGGAQVGLREYAAAEATLRDVLAMPGAIGWAGLSETYRFLAEALLGQGKTAPALEAARRALEIAQRVEQRDMLVGAWRVLGLVIGNWGLETGDLQSAIKNPEECFAESLRICAETGMLGERAWTLRAWGEYESARGDRARGEALICEAQELFAGLGMV